MTSVLRGSQPEQGDAVTQEMVECPLCKGGGVCPICDHGMVKKSNLDRAREEGDDGWSDAAIRRLLSLMLVTPDDDNIDWVHYGNSSG